MDNDVYASSNLFVGKFLQDTAHIFDINLSEFLLLQRTVLRHKWSLSRYQRFRKIVVFKAKAEGCLNSMNNMGLVPG